MSKGEVKAFHAAFVAADAGLDKKVCKNVSVTSGDGKKCDKADTNNGLSKVYEDSKGGMAENIDAEAGANIATSISKLSKEEKATLAAAFAKAVEGAEVVEISSVDSGSIREYGEGKTSRLGIGIGRLSKGDLKAFQAAFVAADAGLDGKVCKNVSGTGSEAEKCNKTGTDNNGLEKVYEDPKGVVLTAKIADKDAPKMAESTCS